jgi:hypothetical protein
MQALALFGLSVGACLHVHACVRPNVCVVRVCVAPTDTTPGVLHTLGGQQVFMFGATLDKEGGVTGAAPGTITGQVGWHLWCVRYHPHAHVHACTQSTHQRAHHTRTELPMLFV